MLGCVCVCARAPLVPRHSWLGSGACVCVPELWLRLQPATPGWGVGLYVCLWAPRLYPATPGWGLGRVCVCLGSGCGCAPPLLAGVLGCVCVRGCAPLVPRHSSLGCGVWLCVLALGFQLCPSTPGWGVGVCVCLCACSACTQPLLAAVCGVGPRAWARVSAAPLPLLARMLGWVCVCGRAPLVPRHSWLGCAAWVCVLGLGFRLRLATPGWGVGLCVCLLAPPACTPPLLAGVCGVGVCASARVAAAPRHSWLGCWGVCVFVGAPCLYPATPGWGVRRGCVCFGSGLGCAPPLLAGVLGCVCVCGRPACNPPLLAGVCDVGVCARARISAAPRPSWLGCWAVCVCLCGRAPLVPHHSWLGCAVWAWAPGLGLRLRPATPGWGVGCVCVCVRAPLVPRHSRLGCALWVCVLGLGFRLRPATPGWGVGVCVSVCSVCLYPTFLARVCGFRVGCCLAPVPVPWFGAGCARCPGLRHPVAVAAWHLSVCLGFGRRRASMACLVAPLWCAAPRPVWSLSVLRSAFPTPWCLSPSRGLTPRDLLGGCAGHVGAGREPGSLCLPLAAAEAAALGSFRGVPVRDPATGISLAGPSGVGFGLRVLRLFACVDPVIDASGFPYCLSFDRGLGRCTGAVSFGR